MYRTGAFVFLVLNCCLLAGVSVWFCFMGLLWGKLAGIREARDFVNPGIVVRLSHLSVFQWGLLVLLAVVVLIGKYRFLARKRPKLDMATSVVIFFSMVAATAVVSGMGNLMTGDTLCYHMQVEARNSSSGGRPAEPPVEWKDWPAGTVVLAAQEPEATHRMKLSISVDGYPEVHSFEFLFRVVDQPTESHTRLRGFASGAKGGGRARSLSVHPPEDSVFTSNPVSFAVCYTETDQGATTTTEATIAVPLLQDGGGQTGGFRFTTRWLGK